MLTTCPECRTAFRVTQEQLGARRGMVRCGRCNAVFNAFDNLQAEIEAPLESEFDRPEQTEIDSAVTEPLPGVPETSLMATEKPGGPAASGAIAAYDAIEEPPVPVDEAPTSARDDWLALAADDSVDLAAGRMTDNPLAAQRRQVDDILLSELHAPEALESTGPGVWKGMLYAVLGILLVVALLAQSAYFLRAELVTWLPELRPSMALACKTLGCSLPLSRDLDALRIEASSLETDPEQAAHARLRVTFSNRARQAQDWPHFILKLSDVNNTAMAQRVFKPKEYLAKEHSLSTGIAARSEHEFQLDLDLGNLSAAGYEVKPYYP